MPTIQERLGPHPMVGEVMDALRPTIIAACKAVSANLEEADVIRANNRRKLTSAERYGMAVMEAQRSFLAVIDRVETSARLLRIYPVGTGKGRHGLSRDRWVDYHFGYLTVALASLPDTALHLANAVLQLGLAPRHRTLEVVCNHEHVETTIRQALRAFSKAYIAHTERRNKFVHRGELADVGDLMDPLFFDQLRLFGFVSKFRPDDEVSAFLPTAWTHAMRELKPHLDALQDATVTHSLALYDALLPNWRKRWSLLNKLSALPPDSERAE